MIDFFCNIYSSIKDNNAFLKKVHFYSVLRALTRLSANILLPIYIRCTSHNRTYSLLSDTHRDVPVIVSLTSFPARINRVWLVIETMLRQTVKPDKIILWLSKEQFANSQSMPSNLLHLQSRGLEIRFVEGDIRSHKKYLYALQQYPEAILITIDDDLFYHSALVEELMDGHEEHPKAIIAHYTHDICYHNGHILSYNLWKNNVTEGKHLFFGSGGGTLFPAHSLHKYVCNIETALLVCANADDIWLNGMARLAKTEIVHTSRHSVLLPILNWNKLMLSSTNLTGGNDVQIQQLTDYCINTFNNNPFEQ